MQGAAKILRLIDTAPEYGDRGGGSPPAPPSEGDDDRNRRLALFNRSDVGNAKRMLERYRDALQYTVSMGWLVWNGSCWSPNDAEEKVKLWAHKTVLAIADEAEAVLKSGRSDGPERKPGGLDYDLDPQGRKVKLFSSALFGWSIESEFGARIDAMLKQARPLFLRRVDEFDADPMKFNVRNGTLVFGRKPDGSASVELQPHDPTDLITKVAPVDYDPEAACPHYDAFVGEIQPAPDMRRFLHQWGGLSLTGVSEQMLVFLYGNGSNGKSVLVDAWGYVAGDYGETVPIETFIDAGKARAGGQATPDLAILPGKRMLRTSEPEKNSKLAEALIKLITGGDPIQARHLNKGFFKFLPQFKLTISGNYRPKISGTDEGIWRRVRLVPFGVFIPKERRDRDLGTKLRAEASGILNRLLDGLRDWLEHGLVEPAAVSDATSDYREDSDPLGVFLAACTATDLKHRVQSIAVYDVYHAWCAAVGENAWSHRGFSRAMKDRGIAYRRSDGSWFLDIKLTKSVGDFVGSDGRPVRIGEEGGGSSDDDEPIEF